MSFEEQQRDELEALAAIYFNEFKLITDFTQDVQPKFSIEINSEQQESDTDDDRYQVVLVFTFPKAYPDIAPIIEIESSSNLEDKDEIAILDILNNMVPDNIGLSMIFTLVSRAFEWINELKDNRKLERQENEARRKKELEELEHKKFEGTRVTVDSFITWKLKFDNEMKQKQSTTKTIDTKKMTGKEMFMQDKDLIESDLIDFADADESDDVKVDEALFADLDDPDFEDLEDLEDESDDDDE